ncbi:gamma-glutamyltransferase family protein [Pseudoroseicyclus sp. CXY001]|uniref:gamma-glutamyltransferase family protein n=1 Tax=Pseudoroseicyclus sp. CXY001 TaxID=3242492 RepID=UPI0035713084
MRDFHLPGRSPVYAAGGAVATSHPLAASVGLARLQAGGNAVDAALAMAAILGICEPQMCGLGGDMFALVAEPGKPVVALNGSGRAPAGLSAAAMRAAGHETVPVAGVEAVTVPGAVDGFCRLSGRYGRTPLAEIFAPAIHYAETGVPVAPRVAFDMPDAHERLQGAALGFYSDGGAPLRARQIFRAPMQAELLRRIAAEGRSAFYEGEVAADMVASLRALGGTHTAADFAATEASWGAPVSGSYRGTELIEHPPNGQGATAILLANILGQFDIAALDPFGAARVHLEAEATKLAYDARDRIVADPDHTARLAHMLAPETAARLAGLISPQAVLPPALPGAEAIHRDTVYLTVFDEGRMAVSLIYSIYHGFGSGLASDRFGVLFQNRGAGFTLEEGHPNEAAGGKRPMHTIIPGMLAEGGEVTGSFGVMGGAYQPVGHARVLSNLRDFGMSPQEALDAPRSFQRKDVLEVERGYTPEVRAALADLGHEVEVPDEPLGGAQMILLGKDGLLEAASDPRKDGVALGY